MPANNQVSKFLNKETLLKFVKQNIPLMGLLVLIILMSVATPAFLSSFNILSVMRQASINGIIAFGMTLVIISGGIDLSVGSTLAFSGMVAAVLMAAGIPSAIAILAALATGASLGGVIGLLISKGKLPPFIATLGGMISIRGLTLILSNGVPVSRFGNEGLIAWIGRGYVWFIPTPVVILFAVLFILSFVMRKTVFGKHVYAIGGNEKGALLSGIKVERNKVFIYMISGFMAALAAVILVSRVDSAVPTAGQMFELYAIAAAVIGGASLSGGRGRISGTIIGAFIIAIINNGLNLLGVSAYIQQLVTGLIIIFAVIADRKK